MEGLICYYPENEIVHNIEVVVSLKRNFLSFRGIEKKNCYIETVNYWKIKYLQITTIKAGYEYLHKRLPAFLLFVVYKYRHDDGIACKSKLEVY